MEAVASLNCLNILLRMTKNKPIKGRASIPAVFSCPVAWYDDQIAYFACFKEHLDLIADLSGCRLPRGQKQFELERASLGIPLVILQNSARMTISKSQIAFRGAEAPLLIFGAIDNLASQDVVFCVVINSSTVSAVSKELSIGVAERIVRYGTLFEKVQLNTYWTELEILSEPFVTNESWGYCPIIHVKTRLGESKYLSVQPRSIRDLLESFRSSDSGIIGIKIRIRKKSTAQESGFEGYQIQAFSS